VTSPVRDEVIMTGGAVTVVGGTVIVVGWLMVIGVHGCVTVATLMTTLVSVAVYAEYLVAREATTLTETLVSVMVAVKSFVSVMVAVKSFVSVMVAVKSFSTVYVKVFV
jgi:hypothetical protein